MRCGFGFLSERRRDDVPATKVLVDESAKTQLAARFKTA
jgi:hypothetical protein